MTDFEKMMAELRAEYVASIPGKIKDIQDHLAAGDIEILRDDFHKLKGTGRTYGIPEITELAEVVEKICLKKTVPPATFVPTATGLLEQIFNSRKAGQAFTVSTLPEFTKIKALLN